MVVAEITPEHFPTPHLALRPGADLAAVGAFAVEQAAAARAIAVQLAADVAGGGEVERTTALRLAYIAACRWRQNLARGGDSRYDADKATRTASRYTVTLAQGGPNYDRIGVVGRFATGARWDQATRTYRGGVDTPASLITAAYGRAAAARFAIESPHRDRLVNLVVLPTSGHTVLGNEMVRRGAALDVAQQLTERMAARGIDTSRVETGGDPIYVVTATDTSARAAMFGEAMTTLATAEPGDTHAWWTAAYLLYQAPMFKKGSDATNRVFLVAAAAALLAHAPVLPHDLDLRCLVLGQAAVTLTPMVATGGAA